MDHPDIPQAETLFGPKSPRPPHPKLPKIDTPAMEVANQEIARLIVNTCFFDPLIKDVDINKYAEFFNLGFDDAELELRRMRR